jgi:hypothetical protein
MAFRGFCDETAQKISTFTLNSPDIIAPHTQYQRAHVICTWIISADAAKPVEPSSRYRIPHGVSLAENEDQAVIQRSLLCGRERRRGWLACCRCGRGLLGPKRDHRWKACFTHARLAGTAGPTKLAPITAWKCAWEANSMKAGELRTIRVRALTDVAIRSAAMARSHHARHPLEASGRNQLGSRQRWPRRSRRRPP